MEIKDIKRIVDIMKNNDLTTFAMKDEGFELKMKRGSDQQVIVATAPAPAITAPVAAAAPAAAAPAAAAPVPADEDDGMIEIPSPIVGTFYRRPSPDADDFARVGMEVTEDTVVCIIEAMKVMNEIKAEVRGTIKKMLIDDASPVQYGQSLFLVEPS